MDRITPARIPVSPQGYRAAFDLATMAEACFADLTAAQAMEAIAIFAGVCAYQNALPGRSHEVLAHLQMIIARTHDGCCRGAGFPPPMGNA